MANPHDLEEVRAVFARHRDELIKNYHAHGAGIGREGTNHVIVVYLDSEGDRPADPVAVEGVQLKFEVTGSFRTLRN